MSVDRKAWGWCPSVLRPMPLDDGLMVRIRVWMNTLVPEQVMGLADLAERYGAGVVELTNRANIQLRGLTEDEHALLVPELDALGLARIDRTPSARVNVTLNPMRPAGLTDNEQDVFCAAMLSDLLSQTGVETLPQKFGFVVDTGPVRYLADVPGDVRIEASGDRVIVRADGCDVGVPVPDGKNGVYRAMELAEWFACSGGIGADGRGRMADHIKRVAPPSELVGTVAPNPGVRVPQDGPGWIKAEDGVLTPGALRNAVPPGVSEIRVTPFRALYLPELATARPQDNKAETAKGESGTHAV